MNESTLIEYIKIQWDDIHHSRNQEWQILIAVIGTFFAFWGAESIKGFEDFRVMISFIGFIICLLGFHMSHLHWKRMYERIEIIN